MNFNPQRSQMPHIGGPRTHKHNQPLTAHTQPLTPRAHTHTAPHSLASSKIIIADTREPYRKVRVTERTHARVRACTATLRIHAYAHHASACASINIQSCAREAAEAVFATTICNRRGAVVQRCSGAVAPPRQSLIPGRSNRHVPASALGSTS